MDSDLPKTEHLNYWNKPNKLLGLRYFLLSQQVSNIHTRTPICKRSFLGEIARFWQPKKACVHLSHHNMLAKEKSNGVKQEINSV